MTPKTHIDALPLVRICAKVALTIHCGADKGLKTISLHHMHRKRMIVFCLLPAYMLLVLHGVIPHHHHFAAENGPLSFHHGFNTHHHDHLAVDHHNDADGHGHTAHFVH